MSAKSVPDDVATPNGFAPGVDLATLADLPPELIRIILQYLVGAPFADPEDLDAQYRANPPVQAAHWRAVAPLISVLPRARQVFYAEVQRLHLNFGMCSSDLPPVLAKCPNLRHLFIERALDEKAASRNRFEDAPELPNPDVPFGSPRSIVPTPYSYIPLPKSLQVVQVLERLQSLTLSYCYNVPEATIRAAARGGSLRELRLVACSGVSWEAVAEALQLSPISKLVFAPTKFAAVPDSVRDVVGVSIPAPLVPVVSRPTRARKRGSPNGRRAYHTAARPIPIISPLDLGDTAKVGSGFREIFIKKGLANSSVDDLTIGGLSLPDGWAEATLATIGSDLHDALSGVGKLRVSGLQFRDLRCPDVARALAALPNLRHLKLQCLGIPVEEEAMAELLVMLGQSKTLRRVEISGFHMEPLGYAIDRLEQASAESATFNRKIKFEFAVTKRQTNWKLSRSAIWNSTVENTNLWVLSEKPDVIISEDCFNKYYRHDSAWI